MEFYSYLWLREDGSPYYVGKGSGKRAFIRHQGHWAPKDHARILIFPQDSEADAFESEIALIWLFGRKDLGTGILRNHTDGGENPPRAKKGRRLSLTARRNISLAHIGKPGHPQSNSTKAALFAANKGRKLTRKHRRKISIAHIGKSAGMLGKHHSNESKQRMSESHAGMKPPSRKGCIPWNKDKTGGTWTAARRKAQENKHAKF